MPSPDARPDERKRRGGRAKIRAALIINGLSVAVTLGIMALLRGVFAAPAGVSGIDGRLAYGAPLLAWPALILLLMVFGVMAARGRSVALNPIDDPESRGLRVSQRVLSNSVEQAAVFVPAFLALTVTIPLPSLPMLPVLVLLFMVGRVLFWAGYLIHPFARAPGMAATLTTSIVTTVWAVIGAIG